MIWLAWCVVLGVPYLQLICPWHKHGMMDAEMSGRPAVFATLLALCDDSNLKGERRTKIGKGGERQMRRDDKGIRYSLILRSMTCFY